VDDVRAVFSRSKREELRARRRLQQRSPAMIEAGGAAPGLPNPAAVSGPHAQTVRQAALDRDAIVQLVESMQKPERDRIADVLPSASALYERVESLAMSLAELERSTPEAAEPIDREIAKLEDQANPLELEASEKRIRRLAFLKRQRRAVADVARRREEARSKLDSCALALQGMRFDLLRFRSGAQTPQGVTQLAEQAMSLAREVDHAVFAADQVSRLSSRTLGQRSAGDMM
jgi:eukaryotic-like serine/threonine-protein kinase